MDIKKELNYKETYYQEHKDAIKRTNKIYYQNVVFNNFDGKNSSSQINLQSFSSSYISSPHDEKFNFDKDEDFTISFWMEPQATGSDGGFNERNKRYIIMRMMIIIILIH